MSDKQYFETEVVFPYPAVVDYPHVLSVDQQSGKYTCTFLIDKDTDEGRETVKANMVGILNAVKRGFVEGTFKSSNVDPDGDDFEQKAKEFMRSSSFYIPLKDGDVKAEKSPEFAGRFFVKASSKPTEKHPNVPAVDMQRRPLTSVSLYSGALAKAKIWYAPYSNTNGNGVTATLVAVVKTGDGERLSAGPSDPLSGFGLPDEPAADPFAGIV